MPIFSYYCTHCGQAFDIDHGVNDPLRVCPYCGEYETLKVVPQETRLVNNAAKAESGVLVRREIKRDPRAGTGEIIKETIEETRKEIKKMEEDASSYEYDPRLDV